MASGSISEWDLVTYHTQGSKDEAQAGAGSSSATDSHLLKPLSSPTARHYLKQVARDGISSGSIPLKLLPPSALSQEVALEALQAAAAALTAFVQLNWTGPQVPENLLPIALLRTSDPSAFPARSLDADDEVDRKKDSEYEHRINMSAIEALTWEGEPAYHLCEQPFYLVFALRVLASLPEDGSGRLESLAWWKLRAESTHSRILDTPTPVNQQTLRGVDRLLQTLDARSSKTNASNAAGASRPWQFYKARLLVERGLALSRVGQDKTANDYFLQAREATGLRYELSGALGKRTKFQKEEKTILVVLAESSPEAVSEEDLSDQLAKCQGPSGADGEEQDDEVAPLPSSSGWKAAPAPGQREDMPSNYSLNDDTLLEQTKFTSNAESADLTQRDPNNQPPLAPLDQCILLSLSLFIRNTSPEHGLTTSQISAFVSRVVQHPLNWSVFTMALLLRSRLEATRTRTAERAVLQLQALLDQMPTADSSAEERLAYFFQLDLPSKWEMQAELAGRYAALGVLRSALEIFERIEMWEEVVQCLGSMGRQQEGIEVVRDLLEGKKTEAAHVLAERKGIARDATTADGTPLPASRLSTARQAKLWCLLGDLEPDFSESHYLTAWETSSHRSARAARSLGGLSFAKQDFSACIAWLHRALKLSTLMPRSWFMLGCAYMRREEWGKAARSFRRTTAIDEEDAEAWNNLASCYLRMVGASASTTVEDLEDDDPERGEGAIEDGASDAGSERTIQTDSGVDFSDSEADGRAEEDEEEQAARRNRQSTVLTPFILKTLAHRCLRHSLRYAPDSWRVWSNYAVASIDIGEMGEACRGMTRGVQYLARGKGGRIASEDVDWQVLQRLVDAVVRAPGEAPAAASSSSDPPSEAPASSTSYEEATASALSVPIGGGSNGLNGANATSAPRSSNSGAGLYPAVLTLLTDALLPALSDPRLYRAQARLHLWRKEYQSALDCEMAAYRSSVACDPNAADKLSTQVDVFREAVQEVKDAVEFLETIGTQLSGGEDAERQVRFKARSLVRSFLGKVKDVWEDSKEYEELVELRDSLK